MRSLPGVAEEDRASGQQKALSSPVDMPSVLGIR